MSVIIKGIKKPGKCKECQFFDWSRCYADLTIRIRSFFDEDMLLKYEPIGNCPLIELPPHGRLIDADEFRRRVKTECNPYGAPTIGYEDGVRVLDMIDAAQTIIPEEEE